MTFAWIFIALVIGFALSITGPYWKNAALMLVGICMAAFAEGTSLAAHPFFKLDLVQIRLLEFAGLSLLIGALIALVLKLHSDTLKSERGPEAGN